MKNVWNAIKAEIKRISPTIFDTINESASVEEISLFEKELNVELPQSFKEYLQVANGQNHENINCLVGYNNFLTIPEIIQEWKMMNELFLDEGEIDIITENKIKPLYWSDKWIPFASFEGSSRIIIDLDSGINGVDGQILRTYTGCDLESDECVISDSFEEFSHKILLDLQNNNFEIDDNVIDLEWL